MGATRCSGSFPPSPTFWFCFHFNVRDTLRQSVGSAREEKEKLEAEIAKAKEDKPDSVDGSLLF